jgi:hypothetical protein
VVPTPAPTPVPTPVNTNLTNLVASQTFFNASSTLNTTIIATSSTTGALGPTSTTPATVDGVILAYNATTQGYTLTAGPISQSWLPTDKDASSSDAVLTAYRKVSGSVEDDFLLFNPGSSNTKLALTYTSYGAWDRFTTSGNVASANVSFFVYGIPTTDMPRTGTANYVTVVDGIWTTATDLRGLTGTGTLSADFGAGTTQMTLALGGISAINDSRYTLGNFTGSGPISSANGSFTGSLASSSTASVGYSGGYAGRFYGPAATEAGATFTLNNGASNAVVGVIVGRK